MGCGPSNMGVAPAYDHEKKRPGTPLRVEFPAGSGGWKCGTVGRELEVEGGFQVRIDNSADQPPVNVIMRRPPEMMSWAHYTDEMGACWMSNAHSRPCTSRAHPPRATHARALTCAPAYGEWRLLVAQAMMTTRTHMSSSPNASQ